MHIACKVTLQMQNVFSDCCSCRILRYLTLVCAMCIHLPPFLTGSLVTELFAPTGRCKLRLAVTLVGTLPGPKIVGLQDSGPGRRSSVFKGLMLDGSCMGVGQSKMVVSQNTRGGPQYTPKRV